MEGRREREDGEIETEKEREAGRKRDGVFSVNCYNYMISHCDSRSFISGGEKNVENVPMHFKMKVAYS